MRQQNCAGAEPNATAVAVLCKKGVDGGCHRRVEGLHRLEVLSKFQPEPQVPADVPLDAGAEAGHCG